MPEKSYGDSIRPDVIAERAQRHAREAGKRKAADHGQRKAPDRPQDGRQLLEAAAAHAGDSSRIKCAAALGRDDVGARQELVAPHVVPVRVGVDERPDRHVDTLGDRVQHALREPQVQERVDQQRLVVADHDPGIRLAPLAVRLQPGERAVADLLQAGREARGFAEQRRSTAATLAALNATFSSPTENSQARVRSFSRAGEEIAGEAKSEGASMRPGWKWVAAMSVLVLGIVVSVSGAATSGSKRDGGGGTRHADSRSGRERNGCT